MKRFLLLITLAILMPLTLFTLGATAESDESLQAELISLRSKVESLEQRVATLETQQADRMLKDFQPALPQMPQTLRGWQRRQFNGMSYYVIPLQQKSKK